MTVKYIKAESEAVNLGSLATKAWFTIDPPFAATSVFRVTTVANVAKGCLCVIAMGDDFANVYEMRADKQVYPVNLVDLTIDISITDTYPME